MTAGGNILALPTWQALDSPVIHADCIDAMRAMPAESIDAVVCDPPYGLEFMGREWDRLDWRDTAGFRLPSIGGARREWPSYGGGDSANPTCAACGGRARGARRCECAEPDWRVKGEPQTPGGRARERGRAMQRWHERWAREALRVLKPGGHLLAFGGTRTFHRLAAAVEEAGFEVRDCFAWLYATGFPKNLDVSKAIDKAAGAERPVVGRAQSGIGGAFGDGQWESVIEDYAVTAPATDDAKAWHGWGTALKPAFEPIVVARRPPRATIAQTVLEHGTGALNLQGCRIGDDERRNPPAANRPGGVALELSVSGMPADAPASVAVGRWPANVLLDDACASEVDRQAGGRSAGNHPGARASRPDEKVYGAGWAAGTEDDAAQRTEPWRASRFFYVPKASSSERDAGLVGFAPRIAGGMAARADGSLDGGITVIRNNHPTVKPIDLMRWLLVLVTPPGGVVLDPFCGSGTTVCAGAVAGITVVGIERDADYAAVARARAAWWWSRGRVTDIRAAARSGARQAAVADAGQLEMFRDAA